MKDCEKMKNGKEKRRNTRKGLTGVQKGFHFHFKEHNTIGLKVTHTNTNTPVVAARHRCGLLHRLQVQRKKKKRNKRKKERKKERRMRCI